MIRAFPNAERWSGVLATASGLGLLLADVQGSGVVAAYDGLRAEPWLVGLRILVLCAFAWSLLLLVFGARPCCGRLSGKSFV